MLYWLTLAVVCAAVYLLPGFAVLQALNIRGVSWIGRLVLSFLLSLVIVPYLYGVIANFLHVTPGLGTLGLLVAGLLVMALALRLSHTTPTVEFEPAVAGPSHLRWLEIFLVGGFILIVAGFANLPRISMLIMGDQTLVASPGDEYWHMAQLVSVARSGLPAGHYLFPDLRLAYYYWSWIYPAIMGNLPFVHVPLARAMAIHSFVQVSAFLLAVYAFLSMNTRTTLARLLGLGFFSVFGGFDYFVAMQENEWWQQTVAWLRSAGQISQFLTRYAWVPQHLAGGMAFVLALFIWRNLRASPGLRAISLGVLAAFCLGTSPYVLGPAAILVFLIGWFRRGALWRRKKQVIVGLLQFGVVFAIGAFGQARLTLGHSATLEWSSFRVPVLETLLGAAGPKFELADHLLTVGAFPLIGSVILLIEVGLPFILYLGWAWRIGIRSKVTWNRIVVLLPPISLLLVFLVTDQGAGGNLERQGFFPAQIIMGFAAARLLDFAPPLMTLRRRLAATYILLLLGAAQVVSPVSEVLNQYYPVKSSLADLKVEESTPSTFRLVSVSKHGWARQLQYVHWLNRYTPENAIIVELGSPGQADDPRMDLLDRLRYMAPADALNNKYIQRAEDFLPVGGLSNLATRFAGRNALEMWRTESSHFPGRDAYLVSWSGPVVGLGDELYRDEFVIIYRINGGAGAT